MSKNSARKMKSVMGLVNDEIFEKYVKDIQSAFHKAEESLKDGELFNRGVFIPAVNQLRYVGSHLIDALCLGDQKEIEEHLQDILRHCYRAVFDSLEAQAQYYLGECDDFKEHFKDIEIIPTIPSFIQDSKTVGDIRREIPKMRRAGKERYKYWHDMEKYLVQLKEIAERWNDARQELNKRINIARRDQRRFIISCFLIIAGIIVSVVLSLNCH